MSRPRKGAVVEWVEHPVTKRRAAVRLDRGSMIFFTREVETDQNSPTFESRSGEEVRTWVLEQLARTTDANNMTWVPVIEVQQDGDVRHMYRDETETHGESLSVTVKRYYLGLTRDEREWRGLPWESCHPDSAAQVPENERYAASSRYDEGPKSERLNGYTKPFRLPAFLSRSRGDKAVLPYTEELWQGLLLVVQHLANSRVTLRELISTKKGVETLTLVGAGKTHLRIAATSEGEG